MKSTIKLYDKSIPSRELVTISLSDYRIYGHAKRYELELEFPAFEKLSMELTESDVQEIIRVCQSVLRGVSW